VFCGMGYSVEVIIRTDCGERRCRQMGVPLFLALGIPLVLALLAHHDAKARVPPILVFTADPRAAPPNPPLAGPRLVPFALFCGLAVLCHVNQRFRAWRRRARGPLQGYRVLSLVLVKTFSK